MHEFGREMSLKPTISLCKKNYKPENTLLLYLKSTIFLRIQGQFSFFMKNMQRIKGNEETYGLRPQKKTIWENWTFEHLLFFWCQVLMFKDVFIDEIIWGFRKTLGRSVWDIAQISLVRSSEWLKLSDGYMVAP